LLFKNGQIVGAAYNLSKIEIYRFHTFPVFSIAEIVSLSIATPACRYKLKMISVWIWNLISGSNQCRDAEEIYGSN
jgi:hypothetical protein